MVRVNFCPFCGADVREEVLEFKWHRLSCGHTVQAPFFFISRPAQDYIYCYQCGELMEFGGRRKNVLVERCPDCKGQVLAEIALKFM